MPERGWVRPIRVSRALRDYIVDPLFASTADTGLMMARTVWGLWFTGLCSLTLIHFRLRDPMTDVQFAQWVGIVSAVAILCTLRPTLRSQRLHCLMLTLSCALHVGLQRPLAYTPHGSFLRSFRSVEQGMTVEQVRTILFSYQASDDHYKRQLVFINSEAGRQWWFHPKYSGTLHLSHSNPDHIQGIFDITFSKGEVVSTYCLNR